MNTKTELPGRRNFIMNSMAIVGGIAALSGISESVFANNKSSDDDINLIGPKQGYSPQVGTLVSMLTWMRNVVLMSVKGMSQSDLDFLFDDKANTIGAMLLHLNATETLYGIHTFDGKPWGKWEMSVTQKYRAAMNLGPEGRSTIKGNSLDFYLTTLNETREKSLAEFRKRDDAWLLTVDEKWPWGPTNNYCKWFHVCEHESNHNGQIKWLKSRIPGAKAGND
ncbi:MAG: hypothetical protein C5B52_01955 [Bacteroidetes bacterium]|nr:MAG: hypothetical protein C5B52_01955 [Bacteroidota bacterium]